MHVHICALLVMKFTLRILSSFDIRKRNDKIRNTFAIILTQFCSTTLSKVFFIMYMSKTCSKQQNKQPCCRSAICLPSNLKKYLERRHTFRECYVCANFCRHVNISYVFTLILINMRTISRKVVLRTKLRVSTQRKEKSDTTAMIRAENCISKPCVQCTQEVKWYVHSVEISEFYSH